MKTKLITILCLLLAMTNSWSKDCNCDESDVAAKLEMSLRNQTELGSCSINGVTLTESRLNITVIDGNKNMFYMKIPRNKIIKKRNKIVARFTQETMNGSEIWPLMLEEKFVFKAFLNDQGNIDSIKIRDVEFGPIPLIPSGIFKAHCSKNDLVLPTLEKKLQETKQIGKCKISDVSLNSEVLKLTVNDGENKIEMKIPKDNLVKKGSHIIADYIEKRNTDSESIPMFETDNEMKLNISLSEDGNIEKIKIVDIDQGLISILPAGKTKIICE